VHSAGLEPKGINPFTLRVMDEIGYDLCGQRAKDVREYLGNYHFGYLITVCAHAEAHCPRTFLGVSERIHWPIEDPAAFHGTETETLDRFRQVRDEIAERIEVWLAELDASAGEQS
jgi:arsenate reductase